MNLMVRSAHHQSRTPTTVNILRNSSLPSTDLGDFHSSPISPVNTALNIGMKRREPPFPRGIGQPVLDRVVVDIVQVGL